MSEMKRAKALGCRYQNTWVNGENGENALALGSRETEAGSHSSASICSASVQSIVLPWKLCVPWDLSSAKIITAL